MLIRKSPRARRLTRMQRLMTDFLEARVLLAADPSFLVHFQGNLLQGNAPAMSVPLQPSTVSYVQNNSNQTIRYQGIAVKGDFDGGGSNNDFMYGFPLSDSTPLSPTFAAIADNASYNVYNGASGKFYGGIIATEYNAPDFAPWGDYPQIEGTAGIHSRQGGGLGSGRNFEALAYWKKEDFLTNSGDPITLDLAKAYFKGTFTQGNVIGRWVVRDGTQFYVSQTPILNENANARDTAPNKYLQASNLANMKWAPYNPTATNLHFDANGAVYTTVNFTDITAVGYFAQKEYNEVQSVVINATAGTFTITFDGKTTAAIPYNAGVAEDPTKSVVSYLNDTFGYFNLRASLIDPNGPNDVSNMQISFDGGNRAISKYAYSDVPLVQVTFDTDAINAGATANITETSQGGSNLRYNSTAGAVWGISNFDASTSGRQDGDNLNISTASFLGGTTGASSINSAIVAPDNTIWLAGTLANDPAGSTPVDLLGGGTGTLLRLDATGTSVLSVTHVGSDIVDMQVRPDGSIALAVTGVGAVILDPTATSVVWSDAMTNIKRITVGTDGMVGALSATKDFRIYDAAGTIVKSGTFGNSEVNDILLDTANQRFIMTGANFLVTPLVKIPFIKAFDYSNPGLSLGPTAWNNYEWTNAQAAAHYGQVLSDSVGTRLTIGPDGYLYFVGYADGGASIFNFDPIYANVPIDDGALVGLDGSIMQGFDTYARPGDHANAATHYTFLGKYNLSDGAIVKANWELTLNGASRKGNAIVTNDIAIANDGRVYLTGSQASEQLGRNGLAIDDISLSGYNGFETFVMVLSPDFAGRERWNVFTMGDPALPGNPDRHGSGGNAIAISPNGNIILAGEIYQGRIYTTANAIQPTVPNDIVGDYLVDNPVDAAGYFVVLPPIPTTAAAPTKLSAIVQDTYQVSLAWQDNATNNTGWVVERSKDGVNYTQIANLASGTVTGYWDETVDRLTTYYYRVAAYNGSGQSAYSNAVMVTTPGFDVGSFKKHIAQNPLYDITTPLNSVSVDANLKYTIHAENNPWVNGSGLGGWGINRGEKYVGMVRKISGDATVIVRRTPDSIDVGNFIQSGIAFQESLVKQASGKVASLVDGQLVQWTGAAQTLHGAAFSWTTNPWWKLSRAGDTFTSYYSADGINWTMAGSFAMSMPQDVFVVIAGHSSYDPGYTFTGSFDNVAISHLGGTEYSNDNAENVYVKASAIPSEKLATFDGASNTAFTSVFVSNGSSNYQQFWNATAGIGGSGAVGAISNNDATAVYKTSYSFANLDDVMTASQFVKIQTPTATNQTIGLGLVSTIDGRLGGGAGITNEYAQIRLRYNAGGFYELQAQQNGTIHQTSAPIAALTVGNWYKLTNTFTRTAAGIDVVSVLEDWGSDGLSLQGQVANMAYSFNDPLTSTLTTANGAFLAFRGFKSGGADVYDNVAISYVSPTSAALTALHIFENVPGAPAGTPSFIVQKSALEQLVVNLTGGDDSLTVDYSGRNPIPANGIVFNAGDGFNTLKAIGAAANDAFELTATQLLHGADAVTYSGVDALTLENGTFNASEDLGAKVVNVGDAAPATLNFETSQNLAALNIGNGSLAVALAGADKIITTSAFSATGTGALDLMDNDMVVLGGNLAVIHPLVASGYASGAWNGAGIRSSKVASENALAGTNRYALGVGPQPGNAANVLVKYTYTADANLDGQVNVGDLGVLASNWNGIGKLWNNADFNFDGFVNVGDLGALASNWNQGVGNPLSVVEPEPVAIAEAPAPAPLPVIAEEDTGPAANSATPIDETAEAAPADEAAPVTQTAPTPAPLAVVVEETPATPPAVEPAPASAAATTEEAPPAAVPVAQTKASENAEPALNGSAAHGQSTAENAARNATNNLARLRSRPGVGFNR